MAPRDRARRAGGVTRMDGAIEALSPMGFSPNVIRRKVNELLKVYGGAQGWAFIEEAYYKLLIEGILEDQEGAICEVGEPSYKDSQNDTKDQVAVAEPSEPEPLCVAQGLSGPEPLSIADGPSCSEQGAALLSTTTVPQLPALPSPQTKDIPTQNSSFQDEPKEFKMQDVEEQITEVLRSCELSVPPGFEPRSQQAASPPVKSKHKPCLGWIGPKDDDDFVLLEPMPVEGQEERRRARGKPKSRWDEKPDDVVY